MPIEVLVRNATGLPEKYVDMAVSYIHFLQSQYQLEQKNAASPQNAGNGKPILRQPGHFAGQITLSDDFDAPLDDFKEYM